MFHKCSTVLLEGALRGDATSTKVAPALFDCSPAIQTPRGPIATCAETSDLQQSLSPRSPTLDATSSEQSQCGAETGLQGAAEARAQKHRLAWARRAIATSASHAGLSRRRGPRDRRLLAAERASLKKNFLLPVQRARCCPVSPYRSPRDLTWRRCPPH